MWLLKYQGHYFWSTAENRRYIQTNSAGQIQMTKIFWHTLLGRKYVCLLTALKDKVTLSWTNGRFNRSELLTLIYVYLPATLENEKLIVV